ncbi:MAG: FMN-binding glutamate synthase family protein [Rhodobacteraceae bacterium]|nr:FMN-binding glutamate synthase family protein [Paracoccaceae bacterium]
MKTYLEAAQRAFLPLISLLVAVLAVVLVRMSPWWLLLWIPSLPLLALSIHDFFRKDVNVGRNYPGIAHLRQLGFDLRPFLRQYIVEDDLEATPYSFEARRLVHARAEGLSDTHPFGSERPMDVDGYQWLAHSIAPATDPDRTPRVTVGNDQCTRPYDASLFNISAMSFGALSANAVEALNLGAKRGGFYHDTGEGGLSKYHLKHGGDVVWEIGSGYFGCRTADGKFDPEKFRDRAQHDTVRMTEIKLSQGAKPGHGGLLPAAKVTAEIAEARQVPPHQDCLSPRGHSAFSSPIEMLEFAARMRDLSGGKPVGLKLCVGQAHEVMAVMKAMLKTGIHPDFIVVDGGEGGTGAAPLEHSDWVGMPLAQGLVLMQNALVGTGLRKHVRLAASGKIYSAMGLVRSLALGADWCNAARAFMFSIGCIQARRCHTGTCPTGVTTQDRMRQRGLVVDVQADRAARFHAKTIEVLSELTAAAGLRHPGDLRPHHLTRRDGITGTREMGQESTFLQDNALIDAPDDTPYYAWWEAADPDSFAPRHDLHQSSTVAAGKAASAADRNSGGT